MSNSIHTVSVGDWSADGHGHYEKYMVSVPESLEDVDLDQMVKEAEVHIGLGALDDYCEGYEDNEFPVSLLAGIVQRALALGVTIGPSAFAGDALGKNEDGKYTAMAWNNGTKEYDLEDEATVDSSATVNMDPETYFGLWVVLANIGLALNSLEGVCEYVTPRGSEPKTHRIGGYGLFFD